MKVSVLIVEDEVLLADEMEFALINMGYEVLGNVTRGEEAIDLVIEQRPDLILMDIKLEGELDGIETANAIQSHENMPIIFLTDLEEPAVWERAKETNPAAYLIKPFNDFEVDKAFQIALRNASKSGDTDLNPNQNITVKGHIVNDRIYLRDGTKYTRVLPEEIKYVKGAGSYSEIFVSDRSLVLSMNLSRLSERLPFDQIVRLHKSYMVNVKKITAFEGNRVFINRLELPIGESYKERFMKKFRLI